MCLRPAQKVSTDLGFRRLLDIDYESRFARRSQGHFSSSRRRRHILTSNYAAFTGCHMKGSVAQKRINILSCGTDPFPSKATRRVRPWGGVLATICPADKKIIHGMKDAILVPCVA
jgi:hypothetical protein